MAKYFVHYPVYNRCNLQCEYCFHKNEIASSHPKYEFTIDHWNKFRDTYLLDAEDIMVQFGSGEPFIHENIGIVRDFFSKTSIESFDIITNGVCHTDNYTSVLDATRVKRIGFTYHRKLMVARQNLHDLFMYNVIRMRDAGYQVYVKELLWPESKEMTIFFRDNVWKPIGIPFLIQPVQDMRYELDDTLLISEEFVTPRHSCHCRPGYKNICINSVTPDGEVYACWKDKRIVGNILRNEYDPDYSVTKTADGNVAVISNGGYGVTGKYLL